MSTLIVYASKYGTTAKCAALLEQKFTSPVTVVNLDQDPVPDLSPYEKIIIGGSVYYGQIRKPCVRFCKDHLETLLQKKVGVYICCGSPEQVDQFVRGSLPAQLTDHAHKISCFGGELNTDKMSWFDRFVASMVSKSKAKKDAPPAMISEEKIQEFSEAMRWG